MADVIPVVFCFDSRIILGSSVAIKSLMDLKPKTAVILVDGVEKEIPAGLSINTSPLKSSRILSWVRLAIAFGFVIRYWRQFIKKRKHCIATLK